MQENPKPSARIFGVVARAAPRVVLIRRGPSKVVSLLTWDTVRHQFHIGQWFKGRIYEERCDVSPSGDKFIYLAANEKPPMYSWTAVSRPPFLSALALWSNMGTWGGGGLFETERTIALNKYGGITQPEEGFRCPSNIRVVPIASWSGRGEDDPIRTHRMKRDGWMLVDEGSVSEYTARGKYRWEYLRPERWRKSTGPLTLERSTLGVGKPGGPWYTREHRLLDRDGNVVLDLGRSDWADWSRAGELLFARDGKVGRVPIDRSGKAAAIDELIDLLPLKFDAIPPPPAALTWTARVKGRRIT